VRQCFPNEYAVWIRVLKVFWLSNRPSSLRKLQDSIGDPKYDGVRTSRKALLEQEDQPPEGEDGGEENGGSNEFADNDDDDESEEEFQGFGVGVEGPWGSEDEDEDEETDEEEEDELETPKSKPSAIPSSKRKAEEEEPSGDLTSTLKSAREADRRKGKAVGRQIVSGEPMLRKTAELKSFSLSGMAY
jgi:protein AATF/BFR2